MHPLAAKFGLWRQRVDHLALCMQVLDGTVTLGREGPARLKARLYCRPSMIGAGVLTWVIRQRRTRMPERIPMQPERRTHKHCASCDLLSGSESTSARQACLWSTTPRGDTGMLAMGRHHPVDHGPPEVGLPPVHAAGYGNDPGMRTGTCRQCPGTPCGRRSRRRIQLSLAPRWITCPAASPHRHSNS